MIPSWLMSTFPIAALFAFRMLGLSMLIPIFTLYASDLAGATPRLLGVALGAYGLTQGLLQIPFGILSDRYGRKPLITLGLILFALGSLLGAVTHTISGMILARILQGSGAIGSVLIALLADITSTHDRTKAMAIIGISIALSFSVAFIVGPIIAKHTGLTGIFYVTAALALLGLVMLYTLIPTPTSETHSTINMQQLKQVFCNRNLLKLDASIFFQHLILIATFFALPMILQHHLQQGHLSQTWQFYVPILILSFLAMAPLLLLAEKLGRVRALFLGSIVTIMCIQFGLAWQLDSYTELYGLVFVFFVAFNCLEANLPSLISKHTPSNIRGGAMGVYSSSQFLGIFVGGTLSGLVYSTAGAKGIFIMNGCVALVWFTLVYNLRLPRTPE